MRPTETDCQIGNAAKAHALPGWQYRVGFEVLVAEMMAADLAALRSGPIEN